MAPSMEPPDRLYMVSRESAIRKWVSSHGAPGQQGIVARNHAKIDKPLDAITKDDIDALASDIAPFAHGAEANVATSLTLDSSGAAWGRLPAIESETG